MATADVVVIGGGVNGTSAAFHLAAFGVRGVVLLERRRVAAGASGKSGALVRMHYTNVAESRLAFESLKVSATPGRPSRRRPRSAGAPPTSGRSARPASPRAGGVSGLGVGQARAADAGPHVALEPDLDLVVQRLGV